MAALVQGNVLTGSIGRVMRGMSVIRGHRMPEGAPCGAESAQVSEKKGTWGCVIQKSNTYDDVMANRQCGSTSVCL